MPDVGTRAVRGSVLRGPVLKKLIKGLGRLGGERPGAGEVAERLRGPGANEQGARLGFMLPAASELGAGGKGGLPGG